MKSIIDFIAEDKNIDDKFKEILKRENYGNIGHS